MQGALDKSYQSCVAIFTNDGYVRLCVKYFTVRNPATQVNGTGAPRYARQESVVWCLQIRRIPRGELPRAS
jgi:hypothetical protein